MKKELNNNKKEVEDELIDKFKLRFFTIALIIFSFDYITTIIAHRFGAKELNPVITYLFTIKGISYFLIYVYFIAAILAFMLVLEGFIIIYSAVNNLFHEKHRLDKIKLYKITYIVSLIALVAIDLSAIINNIIVINQYIQLHNTRISCTFS